MEPEEIIFWREKYEKGEILYTKGTKEELRGKFRGKGYAKKEDLEKIIKWKFQGSKSESEGDAFKN